MVERHETDLLPAFLSYYERFEGYGFWAALEKPTRRFLGWFHFRPGEGAGAPMPPWMVYRKSFEQFWTWALDDGIKPDPARSTT